MRTIEEINAIRQERAEKEILRIQINNLKKKLEESNDDIIKHHEYVAVGLESPYDIVSLHTEREAIREQIREQIRMLMVSG